MTKRHKPRCHDFLIMAPLWVSYQDNIGTLLRSCDATGACMALPNTPHYKHALGKGYTQRSCVHWITGSKMNWIESQQARKISVELTSDARTLTYTPPVRERTIVFLGHEHQGVPPEVLDQTEVLKIPMIGRGSCLNVAVAGSLALYRLSGLL